MYLTFLTGRRYDMLDFLIRSFVCYIVSGIN